MALICIASHRVACSFGVLRGVSWLCVACRGVVATWLCVGMKVYLGNLLL